jgi:hypothetical protein
LVPLGLEAFLESGHDGWHIIQCRADIQMEDGYARGFLGSFIIVDYIATFLTTVIDVPVMTIKGFRRTIRIKNRSDPTLIQRIHTDPYPKRECHLAFGEMS